MFPISSAICINGRTCHPYISRSKTSATGVGLKTTLSPRAMVSVAVSFESERRACPPDALVATDFTFFPGVEGSLQLRRDWLRDIYVGERYQGRGDLGLR